MPLSEAKGMVIKMFIEDSDILSLKNGEPPDNKELIETLIKMAWEENK